MMSSLVAVKELHINNNIQEFLLYNGYGGHLGQQSCNLNKLSFRYIEIILHRYIEIILHCG